MVAQFSDSLLNHHNIFPDDAVAQCLLFGPDFFVNR